jgi:hypothetical protein
MSMQSDRIDDARHPSVEGRAIFHLRATALRFGAALGWDAAEVASFAAALAGRPWAELDTDDLLRAIEEYWQMSLAVAERRTRLTVRPQSGEQRGLVE